jgi:dihydroneopterin aldolase
MTSDVAQALLARFVKVNEARVKVEKPEPEGLDASAEAVELTLARAPRSSRAT